MATYITTLDSLDLTATEQEQQWFERDARMIPASRRDEALRCWLIARRISAQFHINPNWQAWGGKSDAQIVEMLNQKIGQQKRSAGGKAAKKALEAKYGIEAADRIIASKKAGR
jgi:hypothetical protein